METIQTRKPKSDAQDFDAITIKLASPDRILEWSHGEVTKPETINYRTQRSEKNGLFDEKIFGPDKDFECYCGKYRGIRYKGIVCEKCGVEITRSIVRRERMGHIELSSPVAHIWFLKGIPSRVALVTGIQAQDVERVVYFAGYLITNVNEDERKRVVRDLESEFKSKVGSLSDEKAKESLKEMMTTAKREIEGIRKGQVLDEVQYHHYSLRYGTMFEAEIGAEAIYKLLQEIDLQALLKQLEADSEKAGAAETVKIEKRLSLIRAMIKAQVKPEWMFLTRIPVIPAALRPMVPLDGGRFATSDVNDLYRRVINRNNRLKKLMEIHAPEVILRNEKRILQEAVDALIDNNMRSGSQAPQAQAQGSKRALKSLSDNLKSKRGLFRQNLLGKRVDYSGRSVIVVGPTLGLDQCGLPKHMALELFRPFVIEKLLSREYAFNIRGANRLIDDGIGEVWAILEEVIKDKRVLLNRAPTLHRLGIQAFRPVLIEGNAIRVHPLVCTAFNADFDGDQMAVHVPLSKEAQMEANEIMASEKNILKPGNGDPTVTNKMLDIVLGCYWVTKEIPGAKGEGMAFPNPNSAITAYDFGAVDLRAKVKVLPTDTAKYAEFGGKIFETTVGKLLFNSILPKDFPYVNQTVDRKYMNVIADKLVVTYGIERLPAILDKIKDFGFKHATKSGITWGIDDVVIPEGKAEVVKSAKDRSREIDEQYNMGLISEGERRRMKVEVWHGAKAQVEKLMPETFDVTDSVYDMVHSGARGSWSQITQMAGMKGLITNTKGETIEFPVISSSKEGFSPVEYFIATHGSRKGLADTALNTAKAGYLTRKLFVVGQDVMITEDDCKTKNGVAIGRKNALGMDTSIGKSIEGRYLAEDAKTSSGDVLFSKGTLLTRDDAMKIEASDTPQVIVRSPMTCESLRGICIKCYGHDLGTKRAIEIGEAVGTVAAQAIGEPGTQLSMNTKHAGGTAQIGGDIVQGLPRVEEIFENRKPKNPAVVSHVGGTVTSVEQVGKEKKITITPDIEHKSKTKDSIEYVASHYRTVLVKAGDEVKRGQLLTDGSADISELFKYAGRAVAQDYIIQEISKPYELQGSPVSRKHIEVIIKQMFSRMKVKDPGETGLTAGDVVENFALVEANGNAKEQGKEEAKADPVLMGITETSLTRKSFLSAASFQYTTRVLIQSAVRGNRDDLFGLMENVIIGRLIPVGSGFKESRKYELISNLQEKIEAEREARRQAEAMQDVVRNDE